MTVIAEALGPNKKLHYSCRCDCGVTKIVRASDLRSGRIVSCSCRRGYDSVKHGACSSPEDYPEYYIWAGMIQRCTNPNNLSWPYYGGRDIRVCDKWRKSFAVFLNDIGRRPAPDLSIDRIDNNGHYEPGNVRWATHHVQMQNRRKRSR